MRLSKSADSGLQQHWACLRTVSLHRMLVLLVLFEMFSVAARLHNDALVVDLERFFFRFYLEKYYLFSF